MDDFIYLFLHPVFIFLRQEAFKDLILVTKLDFLIEILVSLSTEPPDIGNWFSSYAYQSQELNTIEDFQDSTDSVKPETEESLDESKENLEGNILVSRNNDFLPLDGKGKSDVKNPPGDDTYISDVSTESSYLFLP